MIRLLSVPLRENVAGMADIFSVVPAKMKTVMRVVALNPE